MKLRIEYKDGKKYLIEEKFARDEDLGELHERFDRKLETRNILGKNYVIEDKSGIIREGDIYEITDSLGGQGTMKKSWLHDHYNYEESRKPEPRTYTGDSDGGGGLGCLILLAIAFVVAFWVLKIVFYTLVVAAGFIFSPGMIILSGINALLGMDLNYAQMWVFSIGSSLAVFGGLWSKFKNMKLTNKTYMGVCGALVSLLLVCHYGFKLKFPKKMVANFIEIQENNIGNYYAIVNAQVANIRLGPSTKHSIVGKAKHGETLFVKSQIGNWLLVNQKGNEGFIYSNLVYKQSYGKTSTQSLEIDSRLTTNNTGDTSSAHLNGYWMLRREGEPDSNPITWMKIEMSGSKLKVIGDTWSGKGKFDGQQGFYDWGLKDGSKGRTDIYIDDGYVLHGTVRSRKVNWNYEASRN